MLAKQIDNLVHIKPGMRERLGKLIQRRQVVRAKFKLARRVGKTLHDNCRTDQAQHHSYKDTQVALDIDIGDNERKGQWQQFHQHREE